MPVPFPFYVSFVSCSSFLLMKMLLSLLLLMVVVHSLHCQQMSVVAHGHGQHLDLVVAQGDTAGPFYLG